MSFFSRILKSSFWITLSKLLNRGLAFFCTLILARILTPDDFGIIALATIVTAFFETLGQLGTKEYLLQEEAPSKEDIDTSWTLQLITKIIISIIIFSSSGILADFFNTQDLENLIKVLSITPTLQGITNIAFILEIKKSNFKIITKIESIAKISSVIITLTLAMIFKNYWAFVASIISYHFIILILSYTCFRYKPTFNLLKANNQISFSKWTLLKGITNYINNKSDIIILTNFTSTSFIGNYNICQTLLLTAKEIAITPFSDALNPEMAKLINTSNHIDKISKSLFSLTIITVPLTSLIYINAENIIEITLGDLDKWKNAVEILYILTPIIITTIIIEEITDYLTLMCKVKFLFIFEAFTASTYFFTLYYILTTTDIIYFLHAKIFLSFLFFSVILIALRRFSKISLKRLILSLTSVIIIGLVSIGSTIFILHSFVNTSFSLIELGLSVSIYSIIYIINLSLSSLILRNYSNDWHFLNSVFINVIREAFNRLERAPEHDKNYK
ncbi:hypothetical protein C9I98_04430 [Photobacterium sanctipauli]|uniref:Polysaccharide biosynthesis protein C-terminal domain-containing protein n=2 Tax=Photobacterium sanctipauli TaxID=1342794 RepID=A0A2T3NY43_9GAMM|nr:oligosaccharide flippase family protein [Photobacterium sanctipauli]PSW21205.1 hypothetical protein C9I98_04430 [Photobacterium sanctipauli]